MAGLFHTAPWWYRRPCSYEAGGLGWCGRAVACTDGLGPAETMSADANDCLLICGDNRNVWLRCSLVLTWGQFSVSMPILHHCLCMAGLCGLWEIKSPDPCGRSLLRDHLFYTLEGARSLGGSFIKMKPCWWTPLFMYFAAFSPLPLSLSQRKTILAGVADNSYITGLRQVPIWPHSPQRIELQDELMKNKGRSAVVLTSAHQIRCKTCSFAATFHLHVCEKTDVNCH